MTKRLFNSERQGLQLSIAGAISMAALGIGFFFFTDSEAVLLDGVFSLVGIAVAMITLRVSTLVALPDDEHFHFGYAAYEPMLNLAKGLLIVLIGVFAAISAVGTILDGGREIRGGLIVVYALIACTGCLAIAFIQRRIARTTGSPLAKVDAANWIIDGAISGAVAVAFLVVVLLEGGKFDHLLPYADPVVVILLMIVALPMPIAIIRTNWRQLLGRAPNRELQQEVHREIDGALEGIEGVTAKLRMLETGRSFYLQVYLVLDDDAEIGTIEELDALREKILQAIWDESPDVGVDIVFTRDKRWARMSGGKKDLELG